MSAEEILIGLLIGTFFLICGFIWAMTESEKTKKDLITINENLKTTNYNLEKEIQINRVEFKHYIKDTEKNIIHAIQSKDSEELRSNIIKIVEDTKDIGQKAKIYIDTSLLEKTLTCTQCGEIMFQSGYKPTQNGYVMHYRCKNGHEVQGMSLDDIMDE